MTSKHDTPLSCHFETDMSFVTEAILQGLEGVTIVTDIEVKTWTEKLGVEPNIGGNTPKMDGENNGKPYEQMGWLGGTTIFGNIQIDKKQPKSKHEVFKTTGF